MMIDKPSSNLPRDNADKDVKKRRKVVVFVRKLLHKLDGLGVMKELRAERQEPKGSAESSWAYKGYLT
jgi:hypothetical protein